MRTVTPRRIHGDEVLPATPVSQVPPAPEGTSWADPDAAHLSSSGEARVEGELEPDFSTLGDPGEDDPPPAPKPEPEPKPTPEPKAPEKKEPPKAKEPPKEPPKEKKDEPMPEDTKPPEKKEEPKVEKKTDEKPPEKKTIPKDDNDLNLIQPKAGSHPKVENDFNRLKGEVKTARQVARETEAARAALEAELATARAVKPLDEPTQAKLNNLEEYYRLHEGENDPRFVEQFAAKMTAADEHLATILGQIGVPAEAITKMKEIGFDKYGANWWNENIFKKLQANPLAAAKVVQALTGRENIVQEKTAAIKKLATDREAYSKDREKAQAAWWDDWGKKIEGHVVKTSTGHDWASKKDVPTDASPEQKAAIEAHNKTIDDRGTEFAGTVRKLAALDPATVSDVVFHSMRAKVIDEQLKTTKEEIERQNTRVAELEEQIAEINKAGKSRPSGGQREKTVPTKPQPGQTADEAFDMVFGKDH